MTKIEKYIATTSIGCFGEILSSQYDLLKEIMDNKRPGYGDGSGRYICLYDSEYKRYSEKEIEEAGYYPIVKIEKVTTTIETEEIWHG